MNSIREMETVATEAVREQAVKIFSLSTKVLDRIPLEFALPDLPGNVSYGELYKFLQKAHVYRYPKADHTVDIVVIGLDRSQGQFSFTKSDFHILLIKRGREGEPFYGCWALPGGFMEQNETLEETAIRELREETCLSVKDFREIGTFSRPDRDPRGRVISTAFRTTMIDMATPVKAADDAAEIGWFPVGQLPTLAFDHAEIVAKALIQFAGA